MGVLCDVSKINYIGPIARCTVCELRCFKWNLPCYKNVNKVLFVCNHISRVTCTLAILRLSRNNIQLERRHEWRDKRIPIGISGGNFIWLSHLIERQFEFDLSNVYTVHSIWNSLRFYVPWVWDVHKTATSHNRYDSRLFFSTACSG